MKYKTIQAISIESLDELINKKLEEGWDLYGDLVVRFDEYGTDFYQGMVLMVEGDF